MLLLHRLWRDQSGSVESVGALLLFAIVVFGSVVGLVTLRNQIVQEYGDVAVALDRLNQSWHADNVGTGYVDTPTLTDPMNDEPAGLDVTKPAVAEGAPLPPP